MIGDVNALVGRSFVSKAGNICKIKKLGEGGLIFNWANNPTQEDRNEADKWVSDLLDVEVTTFEAGRNSTGANERARTAYNEWLKKAKL